jgi:hypothetical protein
VTEQLAITLAILSLIYKQSVLSFVLFTVVLFYIV